METIGLWRDEGFREWVKGLTRKLSEAFGPSGRETMVREAIAESIRPYVDEQKVDPLGNLVCVRKGRPGTRMMIAAHMDEVGAVVTHIEEDGFLRFAPVGNVSPEVLLGQILRFSSRAIGAVGRETEKAPEGKKAYLEHLAPRTMFIDIGASSAKEAREAVRVGDFAVYDRDFKDLGKRFSGKALDDRAGCAVLVAVARALSEGRIRENEIHFAFTVQEEVGLRGAVTSSYSVDPAVGIAVDVTRTGDTPKSERMAVSLGKGLAVKVRDARMISHPRVVRCLVEAAERKGLPYQMEVLERGSTDAASIQVSRSGVLAGAVSIPCRYIHTPCEMADWEDVAGAIDLVTEIASSPLQIFEPR